MKKFKEYAAPTVVLLVICVVAALLLAVTNNVTAPKIAEVNAKSEAEARKEVFADAVNFGDEFTINDKKISENEIRLIPALDKDGNAIGHVVITVEKGYGGAINVMTGVDLEGKVTGVKILSMSETAGLGANASRESFLAQFAGKVFGIEVTKGAPDGNKIKALTGATITSNAVTKAVNAAVKAAGGENIG